MKSLNRWLICILISVLVWLISPSSHIIAATQAPGLTVSPALDQITITADDQQKEIDFQLTNNRPFAQTVNLSTADFNALQDTGGLFFIGTNPTELEKKYGLAAWILLPQKSVVIPAKQTVTIKIFVLNQASLAPGGHYGSVMFTIANSQNQPKPNSVSLNPIATALLFVDKIGGESHKLKLNRVDLNHSFVNLPSSVRLHFQNDGNVHLVPRGSITITDPKGNLVSKGILNENSNLILPERNRNFDVNLRTVAKPKWPGKYTLLVSFRFDGYNKFRFYQKSFYIFPIFTFAISIIGISAVGWLIWPRLKWKIGRYLARLKNKISS